MFSQASYASMLETNRGCSELVEAGDYKFHRGNQNPQTDIKFSQILHSFELTQHVSVATNKRNYTLDSIIITRSGDRLVQKRSWVLDQLGTILSDHFTEIANFFTKLSFSIKQIFFRKTPCEQAHRYGRERLGLSNALSLNSAHLLSQNIKQAPFSNKRSSSLLITSLNCRDKRNAMICILLTRMISRMMT